MGTRVGLLSAPLPLHSIVYLIKKKKRNYQGEPFVFVFPIQFFHQFPESLSFYFSFLNYYYCHAASTEIHGNAPVSSSISNYNSCNSCSFASPSPIPQPTYHFLIDLQASTGGNGNAGFLIHGSDGTEGLFVDDCSSELADFSR